MWITALLIALFLTFIYLGILSKCISWYFARKFKVAVHVGRISLLYFELKSIHISKGGITVTIEEICLRSSYLNRNVAKLLSIHVRDLRILKDFKGAPIKLINKITSDIYKTEQETANNRKVRKLPNFQKLTIPAGISKFARFMAVHVSGVTVMLVNNDFEPACFMQATLGTMHLSGNTTHNERRIPLKLVIGDTKAKLLSYQWSSSITLENCKLTCTVNANRQQHLPLMSSEVNLLALHIDTSHGKLLHTARLKLSLSMISSLLDISAHCLHIDCSKALVEHIETTLSCLKEYGGLDDTAAATEASDHTARLVVSFNAKHVYIHLHSREHICLLVTFAQITMKHTQRMISVILEHVDFIIMPSLKSPASAALVEYTRILSNCKRIRLVYEQCNGEPAQLSVYTKDSVALILNAKLYKHLRILALEMRALYKKLRAMVVLVRRVEQPPLPTASIRLSIQCSAIFNVKLDDEYVMQGSFERLCLTCAETKCISAKYFSIKINNHDFIRISDFDSNSESKLTSLYCQTQEALPPFLLIPFFPLFLPCSICCFFASILNSPSLYIPVADLKRILQEWS